MMAMGGFNGREGPALLKFSIFLLALLCPAAFGSSRLLAGESAPPARPAPSPSEEEIGDRWRARAEPGYRRAFHSLEMAGRFAGRLSDRAAAARILEGRAGLLVLLLDARSFAVLKASPGSIPVPAVPLPLTLADPDTGPSPGEEDLRALAAFLAEAGRAYFRSREKELRDLPLLLECLALSERLLADPDQARADQAYRRALASIANGAAPAGGAGAAVARLKYKLRDFEGARAALVAAPPSGALPDAAPSSPEKLKLLTLERDLALFRGAREEALAFERRLSELGQKAEEIPLPSVTLGTFVSGAPADLQRTARTLLSAVSNRTLSRRERLLAEFLAGQAILESGEPAAAAEVLETALARAQTTAPPAGEADPWLFACLEARLGEARDRTGDYEAAAAGYQRALEILAGLAEVDRYRTRISLDLAASLFGLGQLEKARQAALAILSGDGGPGRRLSGDLRVRARILLAGILQCLGRETKGGLDDALAALATAERERKEAGLEGNAGAELRALILIHQGNVHRQLALLAAGGSAPSGGPGGEGGGQPFPAADEERRQALLAHREAIGIASAKGLGRLAAAATVNRGELEIESGDLAAARQTLGAALALARAERAFETEWRARWCLGRIAIAEKDSAAAERELEEAARIVEQHRSLILDADHKAGFMTSKVGLYETMARHALAKGDGPAAFAAAERSRARSFMESLGLRFLLLGADRDRSIYREYLNLLSRTQDRAHGGGQLFGIPAAGSYEDLRSRLEALQKKIRESPAVSPLVHALVEGEPASVEAVQRDLQPRERLVEYFGAEDAVAAFVIGPRSFSAVPLRMGRRALEPRAREFADRKAVDPALSAALGADLLEPVLRSLEGAGEVDSLIIVPFGELHRLPFEALRVGGDYLIERFAVSYLPTASVLKYLEKGGAEEPRPRRLLALADPDTDYDGDGRPEMPSLRGAVSEVEEIAPLFPESRVLSRREATKDACARLAPGREIIHLACHGEFFPARPLDSRLYLSKSGSADGLLRASEIYGIDLRGSRLVALSGCETARSRVGAGEDPVGIGMAFLHTGAGALLASLWKVEDRATALLMKTFYRKWLERGDHGRARALREAKLALLHGGTASAEHWASFILIGPR